VANLTQVSSAERWLGLAVCKQTESSVETCTQNALSCVGSFLPLGEKKIDPPITSSTIPWLYFWLQIWIAKHLALILTQAQRL
jgi:hypothetical protein